MSAPRVAAELRRGRTRAGGVLLTVYYAPTVRPPAATHWYESVAAALTSAAGRQFAWRPWSAIGSDTLYRGEVAPWADPA